VARAGPGAPLAAVPCVVVARAAGVELRAACVSVPAV
jgi:hypothetical protein